MQSDLFVSAPLRQQGDNSWSLGEIVRWFQSGKLLKPDYQRDYVWVLEQEKGWSKSIVDQSAIGVIVTYQLPDGGPSYLADGLQRITATLRFLEDPQRYGFKFGTSQAAEYVSAFVVTVQHRIYETHDIAMDAFQRLNKGTALDPFDFWRGVMVL